MAQGQCFPYRPHDYMYDPIFTVSGPSDHYKAAIVAKMSTAKFQICPIFPNMFSDLPNHPRVQLVRRRTPPIQPYRERMSMTLYDPALHKKVDVLGADRLKFFCPVINFPPKDALPYQHSPTFTIEKVKKKKALILEGKQTFDVQVETKFRESCAQTEPWQPPYKVIGKGDPEILKLEFLKWGSGLPAGMHEVQLIERARMKAAWEKAMQPDIKDEQSLVRFRDYLEALERDEWAFREQKRRREAKAAGKDKKKTARELRKLETQRRGYKIKYQEVNIVEEHIDKKSEIYGPLIRHGEHPKRWHQVIDDKIKKYKAQFIGVEHFSTLPTWLNQATKINKRELHLKTTRPGLCTRETKWTAPVLKQLHEELQNLHKDTVKKPLSLRTKVEPPEPIVYTPEVEGIPEAEEEKYQAIVLLQKIIRGRAEQMLIYEGRDTCKELIQELKHTAGLLKKQKEIRTKEKLKVRLQQREECLQINMVQRLQATLGKLQGTIVGTLLDFLNKELRRLLEERKAHAMCLLNERERYIREAAEAGRRQKELRRRREHDEIFKQIVKVTQESVDVYLQDVITEGMEFASKEEATDYVLKLAEKIEKETDESYEKRAEVTIDEQDEMIADMVHHFILPDVQKKLVRNKIHSQQKENLKTVHESIYSHFENLPKANRAESQAVVRDIMINIQDSAIENAVKKSKWSKQDQSYDSVESALSVEIKEESSEEIAGVYEDPIESYLTELTQESGALEQVEVAMLLSNNNNEGSHNFQFRDDILETITEVDTVDSESSSKKL